ncbi:uncharacterized protein C8R40DRAFT_3081 [Lentinula edodes]|uniref:uncharacterized protein n=1 Tax=Lentinula edodes TaxID=5353 RepID=UPI001E8D1512|nr:uncharacterized protein C8R40DRAFT_3081 [Lentinula edodes]KAH7880904.1 hypothetical protein C8R40DRAFT_3081 [Lentinula edodes]
MKGHFSTRSNRPTRTIITAEQRALLNAAIEKVHYPSDDTIESLSNDLQISPSQIRIWFCNRRQQMRRKEKGNTARSLQSAPPMYILLITSVLFCAFSFPQIPATFSSSASGESECNTRSSAM